jgi:hypothetical protein
MVWTLHLFLLLQLHKKAAKRRRRIEQLERRSMGRVGGGESDSAVAGGGAGVKEEKKEGTEGGESGGNSDTSGTATAGGAEGANGVEGGRVNVKKEDGATEESVVDKVEGNNGDQGDKDDDDDDDDDDNEEEAVDESVRAHEKLVVALNEAEYEDLPLPSRVAILRWLCEEALMMNRVRISVDRRLEEQANILKTHKSTYNDSASVLKETLAARRKEGVRGLIGDAEIAAIKAQQRGRLEERAVTLQVSMRDVLVRIVPIGRDRCYNRYWVLGSDEVDAQHPVQAFYATGRVFVESGRDGEWWCLQGKENVDALLSALDARGAREAALGDALRFHYPRILGTEHGIIQPPRVVDALKEKNDDDFEVAHKVQAEGAEGAGRAAGGAAGGVVGVGGGGGDGSGNGGAGASSSSSAGEGEGGGGAATKTTLCSPISSALQDMLCNSGAYTSVATAEALFEQLFLRLHLTDQQAIEERQVARIGAVQV